ncbi:hypothetical protein DL98DRAFT_600971 [Cadophora sp. DSE1049]|nr:hypothetical protein DL98DRAFT_600971 [Cadophora sp. DSE1049]
MALPEASVPLLTSTAPGKARSNLLMPSHSGNNNKSELEHQIHQIDNRSVFTMATNQHLSKLNPKHPVHFQSLEKAAPSKMPIEKVQAEQRAQHNVNGKSPTDPEQIVYGQALQETILGTAILITVGAYTLFGLRNKIQEDNAYNILCDLHRRELRTLFMGLMITEGLMILCVGLGVGFRIRRAFWEAKGRHRTVKEWSREVLAVLLPFYLGALVGTVTLVAMGLGRLMARGSECSC